jgi:hypothetical protein
MHNQPQEDMYPRRNYYFPKGGKDNRLNPPKLITTYKELEEYTPELVYCQIKALGSPEKLMLSAIDSKAYHCSISLKSKFLLKVSFRVIPSHT